LYFTIHKIKGRSNLSNTQVTIVSIPTSTKWYIDTSIAGRPIIWGKLIIDSITDNRVVGTINFRGTPIPIHGEWNESTNQITFDSSYATFSGKLAIFDVPPIRIRYFMLRGRFIMNPPSLQAGEYGTWIATTDICLNEHVINSSTLPFKYTDQLPPVGVFLTSRNRPLC
jgi:hypothetical protein